MDYLKICNWDKWQTYRSDRGRPSWIKIHRCLLRDPEWVELTDTERGQLVTMWLLAADREGEIPADPVLIQKLCYMGKKPDINRFILLGFIESDTSRLPGGYHHDVTDKIREVKLSKEKKNTCVEFERFWVHWPVKRNKQKAKAAWKRKNLDPHADVLIADVESRKANDKKWLEGFIPHCSTYLNGHRWEDEYGS